MGARAVRRHGRATLAVRPSAYEDPEGMRSPGSLRSAPTRSRASAPRSPRSLSRDSATTFGRRYVQPASTIDTVEDGNPSIGSRPARRRHLAVPRRSPRAFANGDGECTRRFTAPRALRGRDGRRPPWHALLKGTSGVFFPTYVERPTPLAFRRPPRDAPPSSGRTRDGVVRRRAGDRRLLPAREREVVRVDRERLPSDDVAPSAAFLSERSRGGTDSAISLRRSRRSLGPCPVHARDRR